MEKFKIRKYWYEMVLITIMTICVFLYFTYEPSTLWFKGIWANYITEDWTMQLCFWGILIISVFIPLLYGLSLIVYFMDTYIVKYLNIQQNTEKVRMIVRFTPIIFYVFVIFLHFLIPKPFDDNGLYGYALLIVGILVTIEVKYSIFLNYKKVEYNPQRVHITPMRKGSKIFLFFLFLLLIIVGLSYGLNIWNMKDLIDTTLTELSNNVVAYVFFIYSLISAIFYYFIKLFFALVIYFFRQIRGLTTVLNTIRVYMLVFLLTLIPLRLLIPTLNETITFLICISISSLIAYIMKSYRYPHKTALRS